MFEIFQHRELELYPCQTGRAILHQHYEIRLPDWANLLDQGNLVLRTNRVVVYLQLHRVYFTPAYLGQGLVKLVKAIRQQQPQAWVYFVSPWQQVADSAKAKKTEHRYPGLLQGGLRVLGEKLSSYRLVILPITELMKLEERRARVPVRDFGGKLTRNGCYLWAFHLMTEMGLRPYSASDDG
jgi:hypothetical protein